MSNPLDSTTNNGNNTAADKPILVIGASGKTGRRVVDRLRAAGHAVRPASRSSATTFDWKDSTAWADAVSGARSAYITYSPDLAFPGAAEAVGEFVDLALAHDVRRLVLLSGRGEPGAQHAEQLLQDSGAEWTVVRCAFFNQNFDEAFVDAVRYGDIACPGGDVLEPFVDADDIADVVVSALCDARHVGQLYELTGPRLMTFTDAARELAAAIGRNVVYRPITGPEFAADLVALGFPPDEATPVAELFVEVLDGRNSSLADGVEQALGRPPRDFADYAAATVASGVWDLESVS
jgi:uncharacterized protein YbjT (DUF2867 family)